MSRPIDVDPEVRELLQELAGDASAQLLRVSTESLHVSLKEHGRRVFSTAPSLNDMERKLLRAHREELGRLLYRWGARLLLQRGLPGFCRYGDGVSTLPTADAARVDGEYLRRQLAGNELDGEVAALLDRCAHGSTGTSAEQAFAAAMRVRPSPACLRTWGIAKFRRGIGASAARQLIESALEQEPAGQNGSHSWEALGWIAALESDRQRALNAYRAAAECDPDRVTPVLFWLRSAAWAGDRNELLRASRTLECGPAPGEELLVWFETGIRRSIDQGELVPLDSRRLELGTAASELGPIARRIIDAN